MGQDVSSYTRDIYGYKYFDTLSTRHDAYVSNLDKVGIICK